MTRKLDRRQAAKLAALAGVGFWTGTGSTSRAERSPNEKLNLAFIGIGGRGRANLDALAGENVVALCDVDDERAGDAYVNFPQARKFTDFRQMLEVMEKQIDGVVVSTPDHTHFHPAMLALGMGKHLYCEKPMAHSVYEVRAMTRLAAEQGVATQLGVQRHTIDNVHRVVELIQAGAIGDVTACHCWISGDRGMPEVTGPSSKIPPGLNWDLWLGPARDRSYSPDYVPYKWRFWWDFGTGETGNWGCHTLDIPFWALNLTAPTRLFGAGPERDPQRTPKSMRTRLDFPASDARPPVSLHWYHAANGPEILAEHNLPAKGNNTLFIGTQGMLLCGFGQRALYPQEKFADYESPARTIPDSPGFHREWIQACGGGPAATCHFDYSGPLSEAVLLGNVAYRAGGEFQWDAAQLKTLGSDTAQSYIQTEYRPGWTDAFA